MHVTCPHIFVTYLFDLQILTVTYEQISCVKMLQSDSICDTMYFQLCCTVEGDIVNSMNFSNGVSKTAIVGEGKANMKNDSDFPFLPYLNAKKIEMFRNYVLFWSNFIFTD